MHHTLIVANRTASTPVLLQEVDRRAEFRRTAFTLLVPDATPANWTLEDAVQTLRKAAAGIHGTRKTYVDGIAERQRGPVRVRQDGRGGRRVQRHPHLDAPVAHVPVARSRPPATGGARGCGLPVAVITPLNTHGFSLFAKGPGSYESGR